MDTAVTLPYMNKDQLEIFELIILFKDTNVRYIPWDRNLNAIRNIHGTLFLLEHKHGWYLCFLPIFMVEENQLSKILYEMITSGENIKEDRFVFDLSQINVVRIPFETIIDEKGNCHEVITLDNRTDGLLMTFKVRRSIVVPLLMSRCDLGLDSIKRLWTLIQSIIPFRQSVYHPQTFLIDNIIDENLKDFDKLNLYDIDKKTRKRFLGFAQKTIILDELSKVTHFVRDTFNIGSSTSTQAATNETPITRRKALRVDWDRILNNVQKSERNVAVDSSMYQELVESDNINEEICRRGISDDSRILYWDVLTIGKDKTKQQPNYPKIRFQWMSMLPEQIDRNSQFRERRNQIEKDVHRLPDVFTKMINFDKERWERIYNNVLLSYTVYNNDVGYSQAIADILSVLAYGYYNQIQDVKDLPEETADDDVLIESHLFNVLCSLMEKNFLNRFSEQHDQHELLEQLHWLQRLVQFADPDLFEYLERNDSSTMFFCFRWIIVWFAREFSIKDLLRLWDSLLSSWPCRCFDLLICFALLEYRRTELMSDESREFDGVLKFVNSLTTSDGNPDRTSVDIDKIVNLAIEIYNMVIKSPNLPSDLIQAFN